MRVFMSYDKSRFINLLEDLDINVEERDEKELSEEAKLEAFETQIQHLNFTEQSLYMRITDAHVDDKVSAPVIMAQEQLSALGDKAIASLCHSQVLQASGVKAIKPTKIRVTTIGEDNG